MSDEAITITISGNIKGDVANRIRDIATAALDADRAVELLKAALSGFTASSAIRQAQADTRELRNEILRTGKAQQTLAASNNDTAKSFLAAARGADKYDASLRKIDGANVNLIRTTGSLSGAVGNLVGLFGGIFAIQQYAQAQDALTSIQNKIRGVTNTLEEQRATQQALFDISERTRSDVSATTDGFVRFAKAMRGVPQEEVLRFVETLNKSLVSAGRTTGEVNSIVIQLGQALTSGRLMGDEFRSLSENLPYEALQAIADVLEVNVSELKGLSTQGVITTDVLREAFRDMASDIDAAFAETVPTISQAIGQLNNAFIAFTEDTQGGAALVSNAILLLADNLNIVIPIIALFAAAWVTVGFVNIAADVIKLTTVFVVQFIPMLITATTWVLGLAASMVTALIPALVSGAVATAAFLGPWGLLAVAVLAVVAAIAYFTGSLDGFINSIGSAIGSIADAAGEALGFGDAAGLAGAAAQLAGGKVVTLDSVMRQVTGSTDGAASSLQQFGNGADTTAKKVESAANRIVASFRRMTAEATAAANAAYQALQKVGGTSGSFTAVSPPSTTTSRYGGQNSNSMQDLPIPKYAQGAAFMVGGTPGTDKNLVRFWASNNESVEVKTPAQRRREQQILSGLAEGAGRVTNINLTINTPDADSFRRSRSQIASDTQAIFGGSA